MKNIFKNVLYKKVFIFLLMYDAFFLQASYQSHKDDTLDSTPELSFSSDDTMGESFDATPSKNSVSYPSKVTYKPSMSQSLYNGLISGDYQKGAQGMIHKGFVVFDETATMRTAIKHDSVAIVRSLIHEPGFDINQIDDSKRQTLLHFAVSFNAINVIEELMDAGIDLDVQDLFGQTALHLAVSLQRPKIVILLIENEADVNIQDCYGMTALHRATKELNDQLGSKIVTMLLTRGGIDDLDLQDRDGHTAVWYARDKPLMLAAFKKYAFPSAEKR